MREGRQGRAVLRLGTGPGVLALAGRASPQGWQHLLLVRRSISDPTELAYFLPKGWPTTGKVLSYRLKRLQPTLAARSVLIDSGRTSEGRYLEMTRAAAPPPHEHKPIF
jgi:hypothetical protein